LYFIVGPSLRRGAQQLAVKLGSPLSLLCGDQLRSKPPPTIEWQDPISVFVKNVYVPPDGQLLMEAKEVGNVYYEIDVRVLGKRWFSYSAL